MDTKRLKKWQAWDAMQECISGQTRVIAEDLGCSASILGKYQEPHGAPKDSGSPSPVEKTRDVMVSALRHGVPSERAMAPLVWLADQLGCVVIPLPQSEDEGIREMSLQLMKVITESGHVCETFTERIATDGEVSPVDARMMAQEIRHLMTAGAALNQKIQEAVR